MASSATSGRIRIGVSGWRYAGWRATYYPKGLAQKDELAYMAAKMDSIEINGTFYSLQWPESFVRWADATPEDFVFAVKGGRFVTHMKRLRESPPRSRTSSPPACCASGPSSARSYGNSHRISALTPSASELRGQLPHDTADGRRLARRHDCAYRDAPDGAPTKMRLRHAMEIRHESFAMPEFIRILRRTSGARCTPTRSNGPARRPYGGFRLLPPSRLGGALHQRL